MKVTHSMPEIYTVCIISSTRLEWQKNDRWGLGSVLDYQGSLTKSSFILTSTYRLNHNFQLFILGSTLPVALIPLTTENNEIATRTFKFLVVFNSHLYAKVILECQLEEIA